MVRLPASVDDMATVSQALSGSARLATNGLRTSTAGTLLTRLDNTAVTRLSSGSRSRWRPPTACITSGVSTAFSNPATTINKPMNIRSKVQSILL